jgi:hypothetical protein
MNSLRLLTGLLITGVISFSAIWGGTFRATDDDPYNQMVTIKGKVQILNHPQLGRTPANGIYLMFQRNDCKKCLIATRADVDGNYEIRVGKGKYKIIVENPSPPTYDMLASDQPRYVTATSVIEATEFDINLVIHP